MNGYIRDKNVIIVVVLAAVAGLIYFSGVLETPTEQLGQQETAQPFDIMGLLDYNEASIEAWDAWTSH